MMGFNNWLASFVCGGVFAVGLGIARALQPTTIQGFLDVFGNWDPMLAILMTSGIVAYGFIFRLARKLGRPVLAERFVLPAKSALDARLVAGATLFGIGWGIAGVCPGPAVTSAFANPKAFGFTAAPRVGT